MEPYAAKEAAEYQEVLKELIQSQSIFIPFGLRVIRLVIAFIEHEMTALSSKQRMPKRLPKPLPTNRNLDTLVP